MDILDIARKLEPLMPEQIKHWLQARDTADPDLRALIDKQIVHSAHGVLGDFRSKPLLSLPPKAKARGAINLGTLLYEKEKWQFGVSQGELLQNMVILGRSGAGKTNVAFHLLQQLDSKGIPFLFLDWKRTARHLLPWLGKRTQIFTPGRPLSPMTFNPFLAPPGLEDNVYINFVVDVLATSYTLGDGARSVLQRAISSCYQQGNRSPTAQELLSTLNSMPDRGRAGTWKISVTRALESLDFAESRRDSRRSRDPSRCRRRIEATTPS